MQEFRPLKIGACRIQTLKHFGVLKIWDLDPQHFESVPSPMLHMLMAGPDPNHNMVDDLS